MSKIKYISELTGTGKTGKILDKISTDTNRYIIAVPNKVLCKEIFTRLTERNVLEGIQIINMDTHDKPSIFLSKKMKSPRNIRIIITTHASYQLALNDGLITNIKNKWSLIIDEELTFYKNHEFNVSELSKDIIEKTVRVEEYNDKFYEIKPVSKRLWNEIIIGECDETFLNHDEYVTLVKYAHSEHYTTLVPKDNFHAFMDDDADFMKRKFKKFYCISICNEKYFETFNETVILSSFFEDTISFKLLKWMGLELERIPLPYMKTTHPNSHLININYYCRSNWSNILKSKFVDDSIKKQTLEQYIKEQILLDLENTKYIFSANVDFRNHFSNGLLVTSTHGVNKYINHTNMVFMSSLNATASLVNILSNFGITRKEIDFSRNVLHAYQFISRGAVRKPNNGEDINVYVMDKRTVDFLKIIYPNANVKYHDAESMVKISKAKEKKKVPNNVRSFMSRVKTRLDKGDNIRTTTLEKYKKMKAEYY